MVGKVCGTGSYVPAHIMTNDDLSRIVDTNDEWIRERTGIGRRHIIGEETTSYMAGQAAKKALEQSGIDPEEIDMILLATSSSETVYPCAACEVQKMIGAKHAAGYDLNAACTGFVLAFNAAQAYISAGFCRTILVIGADGPRDMHPLRRRCRRGDPACGGRRTGPYGGPFRRGEGRGADGIEQTPERLGERAGRRRGERIVYTYGRTGGV